MSIKIRPSTVDSEMLVLYSGTGKDIQVWAVVHQDFLNELAGVSEYRTIHESDFENQDYFELKVDA